MKNEKKRNLIYGNLNSVIKAKRRRGMHTTGLFLAWGEAGTLLFQ